MLAREMLDHTSQTSLPSPLARERVHTITWPGCDCYVLERVPVRLPNSHSFSKLGGYTLGINTISWVDQFRITPLGSREALAQLPLHGWFLFRKNACLEHGKRQRGVSQ